MIKTWELFINWKMENIKLKIEKSFKINQQRKHSTWLLPLYFFWYWTSTASLYLQQLNLRLVKSSIFFLHIPKLPYFSKLPTKGKLKDDTLFFSSMISGQATPSYREVLAATTVANIWTTNKQSPPPSQKAPSTRKPPHYILQLKSYAFHAAKVKCNRNGLVTII